MLIILTERGSHKKHRDMKKTLTILRYKGIRIAISAIYWT